MKKSLLMAALIAISTQQTLQVAYADEKPATEQPATEKLTAEQQQALENDNNTQKAWDAAIAKQQVGPAKITLNNQAVLNLPKGYVFFPAKESNDLMVAMGNSDDPTTQGMVMTADESNNAMVYITYEDSGYIKDEEAKNWDIDKMYKSLVESTEEQNKERKEKGFSELELQGWVEKPTYNEKTHQLIWSLAMNDKGVKPSADDTINYNTYALGRKGYFALDLITSKGALNSDKQIINDVLANFSYTEGNRYTDFNEKTDKIAAYGIAGLIGGGLIAKKLGLFALIAAFAAKFAKLAVVAVVGVFYGIKKFFTGKGKPEETNTPISVAETANTHTDTATETTATTETTTDGQTSENGNKAQ